MRIVQILPVLAFGDAVGNDTRALKDALLEAGYETEIYAAVIDERLPQGTAEPFDMLEKLEDDDIVIYHLSTGHKLNYEIEKLGGKKVILYHNITPEQYFKKYNRDASCNADLFGHIVQKIRREIPVGRLDVLNNGDQGFFLQRVPADNFVGSFVITLIQHRRFHTFPSLLPIFVILHLQNNHYYIFFSH